MPPPPTHTTIEKHVHSVMRMESWGMIFFPSPLFFFFLQRKHLLRAGMALLKIIKEKVWTEKVNKVIHTSSARDTKGRQREIIACAMCWKIIMSQRPLLLLPPRCCCGVGCVTGGQASLLLLMSCAASPQWVLTEASL